jgi:subtilisin family serine protease
MNSHKNIITFVIILFSTSISFAQTSVPDGWHLLSPTTDSFYGIDLARAYQFLESKNKTSKKILIAVIDSGVDTTHEDLKSILWHNPKEIPNNGIDDDKNGYVDDVYGWNYLGGSDGRNIKKASDEKSRIYHRFKQSFSGKELDSSQWNLDQKFIYKSWLRSASEIEVSAEDQSSISYMEVAIKNIKTYDKTLRTEMGKEVYTTSELESFTPTSDIAKRGKMSYINIMKLLGVDTDTKNSDIIRELDEYIENKKNAIESKNKEPYDYRADFIKDDYNNIKIKGYGNNDVMAVTPMHGTHVTGIIAAARNNGIGMNGVVENTEVMTLRVVPDGDEYDKDIALAIFYAVDNGAKVINMSFGKSYSPDKRWIDSAIQYAALKDVLLVHAAGNESSDVDVKENYPMPFYIDGLRAPNFMTIGASSDPKISGTLAADFSNYGKNIVDVFAPGVKIYSTIPTGKEYGNQKGTSMASPVVAGLAALIRSYYPSLTAVQVKDIIEQSVYIATDNVVVLKPGTKEKVSMKDLCRTGGIVNAYNAIILADKIAGNNIKKSKKK